MTNENKSSEMPTLYEWAGGMQTFEKLTDFFYKKVLLDELSETIFKHIIYAADFINKICN